MTTRPRPPRRALLAACAATAALLLAACGGSTSGGSGSGSGSGAGSSSAGGAGGAAGTPVPTPTPHAVVPAAAALVPADAKARGTLRVATGEGYPPFEFYAADGTTLVGVDPEMITAVAGAMGLRPQLSVLKFDGIIPGIQGGRYDVGAAAMGITPARNRVVDFVSYFQGGTSIMLPAGNPLKLTLDGLCGRTVAVEIGTIYADDYLPKFTAACTAKGAKPVTVATYPDQPQATLALSSGRADATMSDFGPLAYIAQQSHGKFEVLDANYQPAPYGIALAKGSPLAPAVQQALQALVADGTYRGVLQRWRVQAGAIGDPAVSRG